MATLTTVRLILRQWRDDDLSLFAALNADARVMEFMPKRLSGQESDAMVQRIRSHIDGQGWGLWAVEVPAMASFIGFVGLSVPKFEAPFMPCVEIGWRLAHAHWGHGYATEAACAAAVHGFDVLGLSELVSFTAHGNQRSRSVMQRLGMRHDSREDFDHPALPSGHLLQRHVLYRVTRSELALSP